MDLIRQMVVQDKLMSMIIYRRMVIHGEFGELEGRYCMLELNETFKVGLWEIIQQKWEVNLGTTQDCFLYQIVVG